MSVKFGSLFCDRKNVLRNSELKTETLVHKLLNLPSICCCSISVILTNQGRSEERNAKSTFRTATKLLNYMGSKYCLSEWDAM